MRKPKYSDSQIVSILKEVDGGIPEAHIQKLIKGKKLSHTGRGKDIRLNQGEVMTYRIHSAEHLKRSSKKPAENDGDIGLYDFFIDSFGDPATKD